MPEQLTWGHQEVARLLELHDRNLQQAGYAEAYAEDCRQKSLGFAMMFPANYDYQAAAASAIAAETYFFVSAYRPADVRTDTILILSKINSLTGRQLDGSITLIADQKPTTDIWTPREDVYRNIDLSVAVRALVEFEEVGLQPS